MSHGLDRTAELMTDEDIVEVDLTVTTILVPTDGSATAVEATKVALSLAKRLGGAEVIALFVGPARSEDPMQYLEQERFEGGKPTTAGLDVALKLGVANGVGVTAVHRDGAVAHEILKAVEEYDAQMIVMGSEGRSGLKRLALGSIAESVVKQAHVPVTVVRYCSTEHCMTRRV